MGDAWHTLGIAGIVPAGKRLDRAINLLELMLKHDSRFILRVKEKHPLDYTWLLNRPNEPGYYRTIYHCINSNSKLRYQVVFGPSGDNLNDWFSKVVFIVFSSDSESFYMSLDEGMLTASVPVILNWDGADEIWPKQFVFENSTEAARFLQSPLVEFDLRGGVLEAHSSCRIAKQWQEIISGTNGHA